MDVWANPACSKSRAALAALTAAGIGHTTRRYLDDPPTTGELDDVLTALALQPWDIARLGEPVARELGLAALTKDPHAPADRARWIKILTTHPILIQRPILIATDGSAHLGRDTAGIAAAITHEQAGG